MTSPAVKTGAAHEPGDEVVEVKNPSQHYDVDEGLSELERARLTSKTWSMEQE